MISNENAKALLARQMELYTLQSQMIDCLEQQKIIFEKEAKNTQHPMFLVLAAMNDMLMDSYKQSLEGLGNNVKTFKNLVEISQMPDEE